MQNETQVKELLVSREAILASENGEDRVRRAVLDYLSQPHEPTNEENSQAIIHRLVSNQPTRHIEINLLSPLGIRDVMLACLYAYPQLRTGICNYMIIWFRERPDLINRDVCRRADLPIITALFQAATTGFAGKDPQQVAQQNSLIMGLHDLLRTAFKENFFHRSAFLSKDCDRVLTDFSRSLAAHFSNALERKALGDPSYENCLRKTTAAICSGCISSQGFDERTVEAKIFEEFWAKSYFRSSRTKRAAGLLAQVID